MTPESNTTVSNTVSNSTETKDRANELIVGVEAKINELSNDVKIFKEKIGDYIDDIDFNYIKSKIESKANSIIEDVKQIADKVEDKVEEAAEDVKGWLSGNRKLVIYGIGALIVLIMIFNGLASIFPV